MQSTDILHQSYMKTWFRKRHKQIVKEPYLKTQRQLMDDQAITKTFHLIDRDQSNTLDMEEIFTMFKKNGYPINMALLRRFFNATDKDHNRFIDLDEFKSIVNDEEASQSFRQMMRNLRKIGEENYYSTDFVKLLRYFCYCQNRSDITMQLSVKNIFNLTNFQNHRLPNEQRSNLASSLLKLTEQFVELNPISQRKKTVPILKKQNSRFLDPIKYNYSIIQTTSTTISDQRTSLSISSPMKTQRSYLSFQKDTSILQKKSSMNKK